MARLAGEIADGVNFNCLLTPDYMREVTIPAIAEGAESPGAPSRSWSSAPPR